MKTITFDIEKANAVENAVCEVFDCRVSEIISLKDTQVKKVVVFILSRYFNIDKRVVGHQYQMTYLYVPTVVDDLQYMFNMDPFFNAKVMVVLRLVGYNNLNL